MANHKPTLLTNKKIQTFLKIILILVFLPVILKFHFYQLTNISLLLSILTLGLLILFVKSWNKKLLIIGLTIALLYSLIFHLAPALPCKAANKNETIRDCDCLGIQKSTDMGFSTSCIGLRRHCYAGPKRSMYYLNSTTTTIEHPENLVDCIYVR